MSMYENCEKSLVEIEDMLIWLDGINLSRPNRKLSRDFSDAVLMAEVIKESFPRMTVDLHNYPSMSAVNHKLENWLTLNQKLLRRLNLAQPRNVLEDLANAVTGVAETLLCKVKDKALEMKEREERLRLECAGANERCECMPLDVTGACSGDVFMAPKHKHHPDGTFDTTMEKVILYSEFSKLEKELYEKNEALAILKQKVNHLDNLLQIKDGRISELLRHLKKTTNFNVPKAGGDSLTSRTGDQQKALGDNNE